MGLSLNDVDAVMIVACLVVLFGVYKLIVKMMNKGD